MATFKAPVKKKQKKGHKLHIPLPIPIINNSEEAAKSTWCYYHGKLVDDHVVIEKSGDAFDLSHQGCFGRLLNESHHQFKANSASVLASVDKDVNEKNVITYQNQLSLQSNNLLPECDEVLQVDRLSGILNGEIHLNLFESFFLTYGIGCLFVERNAVNMTISDQWFYSCARFTWFPIYYAAYHYFRSKGWIPKDGIRYGADFLLYRKGPSYYHASYIVVIRCINADTLKPINFDDKEERKFSWETLTGLLRLATTVSKEIMFCYIALPAQISTLHDISHDTLKHITIHENIISRWVSSKDREKELLDVDCDY